MKIQTDRELTDRQHNALDRLEKKDENAIVIGWAKAAPKGGGPVVKCEEGRLLVRPSGYTSKME